MDDQTIQDNPNASSTRQTIQSKRTYLCDASFAAVVVPGPGFSREALVDALARPVFAPYLGRRACVPSTPLLLAPNVTGDDPLELFDGLARGPQDIIKRLLARGMLSEAVDYYLDTDDDVRRLRRIPLRDQLNGALPRQWRERFAVHVRGQGPHEAGEPFDVMKDWDPIVGAPS